MKKAFTLLELLITFTIMSLVMIVFVWALSAGFDTWMSGKTRADIQQSSDIAIETMVRWISQATSITAATASSITLTADINGDAIPETATFTVSGSNLQRTVGPLTIIMVPNTTSFGLVYTNAAGTAIVPLDQTARDTIKLITLTLTVLRSGETKTYLSGVYCRNR